MVRRLARELDIDLNLIQGSGPEGRITHEDLETFARQQQRNMKIDPPSATLPAAGAPDTPIDSTFRETMQQAIAKTVTVSWQTIPHFQVTVEINMDACREIISELKEGPNPIGYNALVIKACAITLPKFPLLCSINSSPLSDINISFAVSKRDGLMMPVIRKCQSLSVVGIESEVSLLAGKCESGRLTSEELSGGSFSISNLGMYGVDEFSALIQPGQTAILAVGAVRERPVVQKGQITVATTMRVTLSSDHRVVYGAYAASFLAELRTTLEKPVSLLM